jgi:hypothetical protein
VVVVVLVGMDAGNGSPPLLPTCKGSNQGKDPTGFDTSTRSDSGVPVSGGFNRRAVLEQKKVFGFFNFFIAMIGGNI